MTSEATISTAICPQRPKRITGLFGKENITCCHKQVKASLRDEPLSLQSSRMPKMSTGANRKKNQQMMHAWPNFPKMPPKMRQNMHPTSWWIPSAMKRRLDSRAAAETASSISSRPRFYKCNQKASPCIFTIYNESTGYKFECEADESVLQSAGLKLEVDLTRAPSFEDTGHFLPVRSVSLLSQMDGNFDQVASIILKLLHGDIPERPYTGGNEDCQMCTTLEAIWCLTTLSVELKCMAVCREYVLE